MLKKYYPLAILLIGIIFLNFATNDIRESYSSFGGGEDFNAGLPNGTNSLFSGSGKCAGCHGFDPLGIAGVNPEGSDINLVDDWRASMMANAAKDPFWKAKVSHEVMVNPDHQIALEDKCISCHAPQGRFAAIHDGAPHYSMAEMLEDSLALDGVSCSSCHQQRPENIGSMFSGNLVFDDDTIYGPFGGPDDEVGPIFEGPMQSFVGYTPVFGDHISKSELCAACHTLQTESVDLDGEFTGTSFVEQATYHEWLNSTYSDDVTGTECQACHFPQLDIPVVLSTNYAFLQGRQPYGRHFMVGGNSFMLNIFKNEIETLGLAATEDQFQNAIDKTIDQLQNNTATLTLSQIDYDDDSARYEVNLINHIGHKFPSGYPSRRAFIEFVATGDGGEIIFESGVIQEDFEVFGQNDTYEPHYDLITNTEQVQIYEMVMGDVNNDVTTVLERAHHPIKDNRIVPEGFSTIHPSYDTTAMAGLVLTDDNFNDLNSGEDNIKYHFPLNGYTGEITVTASLYYQSDPPKWNEEMFAMDSPEINLFEELYLEYGAAPVLIDSDINVLTGVGVSDFFIATSAIEISNTIVKDNKVTLSINSSKIKQLFVYNSQGKIVIEKQLSVGNFTIDIPKAKGVYYFSFEGKEGQIVKKVVNM